MKTSVVMSTYNGEEYIIEQLDSLRNQSRPADEVLIADDCSTDNTVDIVRNYIKKNNLTTWKLVVNKQNKGWRRNFMEAMWSTSGDLVFPCDQDDIWRLDKIEIMTKLMGDNSQIQLKPNYLLVDSPGCTYCIRRGLLNLSKKYWKSEYPHDALLWRMGLMSNGVYAYTDDLIRWRNHKKSAFAKESKKLKSVGAKKEWIRISSKFNDESMQKLIKHDIDGDTSYQQKVIDKNSNWLSKRMKFYKTGNLLRGVALLSSINCYPRLRQYLGDWYLICLKK